MGCGVEGIELRASAGAVRRASCNGSLQDFLGGPLQLSSVAIGFCIFDGAEGGSAKQIDRYRYVAIER